MNTETMATRTTEELNLSAMGFLGESAQRQLSASPARNKSKTPAAQTEKAAVQPMSGSVNSSVLLPALLSLVILLGAMMVSLSSVAQAAGPLAHILGLP